MPNAPAHFLILNQNKQTINTQNSLHPYPNPPPKNLSIFSREPPTIWKLQPPLSSYTRRQNRIPQIVGALGTPLTYSKAVFADLVAEEEHHKGGDANILRKKTCVYQTAVPNMVQCH